MAQVRRGNPNWVKGGASPNAGGRPRVVADIQDLARYVLGHRVWLGPHAASHGVSVEMVIDDIIDKVPVP